jgi:hypothetical protein
MDTSDAVIESALHSIHSHFVKQGWGGVLSSSRMSLTMPRGQQMSVLVTQGHRVASAKNSQMCESKDGHVVVISFSGAGVSSKTFSSGIKINRVKQVSDAIVTMINEASSKCFHD